MVLGAIELTVVRWLLTDVLRSPRTQAEALTEVVLRGLGAETAARIA